jgi:hypothetical protein
MVTLFTLIENANNNGPSLQQEAVRRTSKRFLRLPTKGAEQ